MLTSTIFELAFETDKPFNFVAGQFISIIVPGAGPKGRDLRRAYSIASAPEMTPIELCIKVVGEGPGTQYLYQLRSGKPFKMVAPYGDFVYRPNKDRNICFVATGTGIAPFRSIVMSDQYKNSPPKSAYCFFGTRKENELIYLDLFENHPALKFVAAISQASDSWKGFRGRVTDYIKTLDESFPWLQTEYYLCGHGGMIQEVKGILLGKGVAKDSIHQEIYYR